MLKSIRAISIIAIATASAGFASAHPDHDEDEGSKNRVEQSFNYTDFDRIRVVGVYDMDVKVGGSDYSIDTAGREKDMNKMKVYLDGDTLVLANEDKKKRRDWKGNHKGIDITITMPALNGLEITGIGNGVIDGIESNDFEIEVAGIGAMELNGRCDTLVADYAGMGELDARGLKCKDVTVDMSGMGSATVFASESVDADMSGMGSIEVYGDPKNVETDKSFMSSIDIK